MVIHLNGQTFSPAVTIPELGGLHRMLLWVIQVEEKVLISTQTQCHLLSAFSLAAVP